MSHLVAQNGPLTHQQSQNIFLKLKKVPGSDAEKSNVKIKSIDGGYFAAITYSGSASENNFLKHVKILSQRLLSDKIIFFEPAIRATYNGPFTPPFMRRNEVIYKIKWEK